MIFAAARFLDLQPRIAHITQAVARLLAQASSEKASQCVRRVVRQRGEIRLTFEDAGNDVSDWLAPSNARLPVRSHCPIGLLDSMDRGDMRMIERGEGTSFAVEASESIGSRGDSARQDLERDVVLESFVASPVDLAHAARPDH